MSLLKTLSLAVSVLTAGLVGVFAWLVAGDSWWESAPMVSTLALGCVLIGLFPGVLLWVAASWHEHQIERLTSYVETMLESEEVKRIESLHFGLDELKAGVQGVLGQMHARVASLASQRQQLESRTQQGDDERRYLQAILHAISDPVLVTDAFNEVVLANGAARRLMRQTVGDFRHQAVGEVMRDAELSRLICESREQMGSADRPRHVEYRTTCDGQARVFGVSQSAVPAVVEETTGGGTAVLARTGCAGLVTILRDMTGERAMMEMKGDFVSSVSHELRTPLASIRAYMEMLVDGEAEDAATRMDFYNVIQGEANRLSRLIDNILSISRIEAGYGHVQREKLSMGEVVGQVVDAISPQARAKDLTIEVEPASGEAWVIGDRDLLVQALLNLMSNAVKYTPRGGLVTVGLSCDTASGLVRLTIRDTGVGIPPEDLSRIFEKFYRVADHKRLAKGTGLGLNMVKHVVETVHDGTVEVQSTVDQGSAFTLTLSMADKE